VSFRLLSLLLGAERKLFLVFVGLMILLLAFAEFSLISLLPIFTAIIQGTNVKAPLLFQKYFPIELFDNFVHVSILIVCLFFVASLLRTIIVWAAFHISADRQTKISSQLYAYYLRKSLVWHGKNPPSSLVSESLNEVKRTVEGVVNPLVQVVSQGIVIISILLYLIIFDPIGTLLLAGVFIVVYGLLTVILKGRIELLGQTSKHHLSKALRLVNTSFNLIRHVKTLGVEPYFESNYKDAVRNSSASEGWAHILANVPRYMVEAAIVSAMFGMIFLRFSTNEFGQYDFNQVIQIFAVFVFAGFRLLPAISIIQSAYANFTYVRSASSRVFADLVSSAEEVYDGACLARVRTAEFDRKALRGIILENISFKPDFSKSNLLDIERFELSTKGLHAIVGPSGSGKSLLAECVSGLHTEGFKVSDIKFVFESDEPLHTVEPSALVECVAYSPQRAGIFSSSIEHNLSFPLTKESSEVNSPLLILRRILGETSFDTLLERNSGVEGCFPGDIQASVGQTLAVSLTRALASDKPIIFLDEPNASFDVQTESALQDILSELATTKAVYMVTHRLERLKDFETVTFVIRGSVGGTGTHESMLKNNIEYEKFLNSSANRLET
jgi:ABC-type multidrug transport system fused ATPase/permease subunit